MADDRNDARRVWWFHFRAGWLTYMRRPLLARDMLEQLKRVVRRGAQSDPVRECRRCGTTVERAASGCPACESTDIVQYDL